MLHGEDGDKDDTVGGEGEDGDGGEHHHLLPLQRLGILPARKTHVQRIVAVQVLTFIRRIHHSIPCCHTNCFQISKTQLCGQPVMQLCKEHCNAKVHVELTTDQTDWDYAIIIEGMAEQFFEEKTLPLRNVLIVQLQFLATEEVDLRHISKFLSWHVIWHICSSLFDCKKNVKFFEFAKVDWLYPNVGLTLTGERLCWSVRGEKEDRGPDLPPSTASSYYFSYIIAHFKEVFTQP